MKTQFIILLKGINVGGRNIIRMKELRDTLKSKGFEDIETILQSGNIILTSHLNKQQTKEKVSQLIAQKFDLNIPVLIVSKEEIEISLEEFPFFEKTDKEDQLHITFLDEEIPEEQWNKKISNVSLKENLALNGQYLYLFTPEGYHKAKLNATFIADKFGINATNRNIKTLRKILAKT